MKAIPIQSIIIISFINPKYTHHTMKYIFICLGILSHLAVQAQNMSFAPISNNTQAIAQSQEMIERAAKVKSINDVMEELYDQNQFNGVVMIIEKGEVIYQKALGWSNIEKKDTLTIDTSFRLASVSKQFTAMCIMMLYEQGKLNYDDAITQYIPELPYKNVSIRNLLNHNSGIPDYFGIGWSIQRHFPTGKLIDNNDLIKYFSDKKPGLQFKPGTRASYSNTAYAFLASIVERVSGESFADFLQKNIFKPLDMKNAFVYNTKNIETKISRDTLKTCCDTIRVSENEVKVESYFKVETHLKTVEKARAFGYQLTHPYPLGYSALDFHEFDGIAGEKSICVSATDLAKWDRGLHEYRLISEKTQSDAYRVHPVSDKKEYGYGFGWKVYTHNPKIVFHHGLYRGFRNYFERNLETQRTVIILSNRALGGRVTQIHYAIDDILANKKYKTPSASHLEKNTYLEFKKKFWIDYKN